MTKNMCAVFTILFTLRVNILVPVISHPVVTLLDYCPSILSSGIQFSYSHTITGNLLRGISDWVIDGNMLLVWLALLK